MRRVAATLLTTRRPSKLPMLYYSGRYGVSVLISLGYDQRIFWGRRGVPDLFRSFFWRLPDLAPPEYVVRSRRGQGVITRNAVDLLEYIFMVLEASCISTCTFAQLPRTPFLSPAQVTLNDAFSLPAYALCNAVICTISPIYRPPVSPPASGKICWRDDIR